MAVVDVRSHGAIGDGVTDDYPAVLSAIRAVADVGGTVFFPAGDYALSASLGDQAGLARVWLLGDGERAARLLATGNFAPISGRWIESRIENLVIDADFRGGPGLDVDVDKSYVRHCRVRGWSDYGIRLNATTEGLLNWIDDNFVEQCTGYGVYTTYRFYDSWIVNNNVGSTRPNLSVESGPVRILANHLNGAPENNIELRGNKSLTIVGNICEGARREAIIYTMPSFLDADSPQVQIVANNITNGGKGAPDAYPAIGIYSRDADHRTKGFNITGNFIANEDEGAGWSYAVDAEYVDDLAISGNQWDNNGFSVAAVRASGRNVGIAGNTSANLPTRVVNSVSDDVTMAAASGTDYVYLLDRGAEATLPTAVGNTNRYTVKNLAIGASRLIAPSGQEVDGGRHVRLGRNDAVDVISDGQNWWTV
ncbi:right-handed parallel beta-helix repeat-containing protein [Mycolicibacterium wolinskyi]|uniref:Rhamnogalacturonase A/B/Epimerase-like pectate lyase domain-containing protein n=1 Tax=Mycolicibacterium wolinskyi TaxID=59750 RepID=A0A1X2FHQ0_9MYCO|nr:MULTISPECIES: glycosyl hydrolase family 28-related protein [Mycolicibacterium]MCV7284733.1 right-handed parallel beta-helix repeat-containing protein [Mycolicibacterium wolinskyi]MCV7295295.1 right-handed parallel beta-helix repeat-containing protein [Mycolicibacterium goodii]ORX17848.1 hypothetical protein AWC31_15605 [Mycolicibacterium wolinskyi]